MKKLFVFIIAIVIGSIGLHPSESFADIILAKKEKVLPLSKLKVFQVIDENGALVEEDSDSIEFDRHRQLYLLVTDGEELYYDRQKVKVPKGKVIKMIGTYQYENRMKIIRTVPAIRIDSLPKKKKSK